MFDTMKVAREIREARIAQNMTQMNLADAMGVSYQAVSNWERGNSMPDIGKLEELCEILDISLDRLLGVQRQVQNVQKVIDYTSGKTEETLSLEEIRDAVPLMEPEQVQKCVGNAAEETERISLDELMGLAPFAGKGTLKKLAEKVEEVNLDELVGLAPFVDRETLKKLTEKVEKVNLDELVGLAPFADRETLNRLAEKINVDEICPDELCGLAPFVSKDTLENLAGNIKKEKIDLNALQGLASFLGKDKLEELLRRVYGS
ncbi:MAG: helix-turn-helix domain-containing protein [Acetatifactor sp.]|nr:helix-turn-helix domain-containing protein [Acetatifactor sp.]